MDLLRHHVLLTLMPVFFLSTGLRTNWEAAVYRFGVAALLFAAAVSGNFGRTSGRTVSRVGRLAKSSIIRLAVCKPRPVYHDHLCQRAAGQAIITNAMFTASVDGGGEHHDDGADRRRSWKGCAVARTFQLDGRRKPLSRRERRWV